MEGALPVHEVAACWRGPEAWLLQPTPCSFGPWRFHGLGEFMKTRSSLPRDPTPAPAPSSCPRGAASQSSSPAFLTLAAPWTPGWAALRWCGLYAVCIFIFFQHIVKFITPHNDFLTVLGKGKGEKKRP